MGANAVLYRLLDRNATVVIPGNTNLRTWTSSRSASPTSSSADRRAGSYRSRNEWASQSNGLLYEVAGRLGYQPSASSRLSG